MAEPNLQEIHDFLVDLARKAGQMITSANPSTVDTKKNSSDLVTETDKAVENEVSSSLKAAYPSYQFLGEESSPTPDSSLLTPAPTFIVDPIDGTTNFVHAFPYISISLAFAYNLVPLVGVVYNPFTQQLYHAIKGRGAFLTAPEVPSSFPKDGEAVNAKYVSRRLPFRQPAPPLQGLSAALVAVEWGNERRGSNWEAKTKTFNALAGEDGSMVQSLRSLGSAALNACGVAAGTLDAYWEGGCWAWDIAAGWVIATEAGGKVVGGNPGENEVRVDARRYLVVRGGDGQEDMVRELWSQMKGTVTYEGSGEMELNKSQLKA